MNREQERAIEWDCIQVLYEFYACLDEKRYDDLVDLFVEDGTWVRLGKELTGPQNIKAAMVEREDWLTAHLVTNARVSVRDENRADTVQYITLYRQEGVDRTAGPSPVVLPLAILCHRDQLVRAGGKWKFKRKTSQAVMVNRATVKHYDKGNPEKS